MKKIDYKEVKADLERKNLYDIQLELTQQRRRRTSVISLLMLALLFTLVFGMLENPIIYTMSNIGNFFTYRLVFIIWAIITGISIEAALLALFDLEEYKTRYGKIFVLLSVIFLIATGLIPALKELYPIWHYIHTGTSGLHALFLYMAMVPFTKWVSKENPRLRITLMIWQIVIWIGSVLMVVLFWHSAMFELWFFVTNIVFLLYLSMILFEEKIIKMSVKLLMNESNLNIAIEKVFVNLENRIRKDDNKESRIQ